MIVIFLGLYFCLIIFSFIEVSTFKYTHVSSSLAHKRKVFLFFLFLFLVVFGGGRNVGFGFDDLNYAQYFVNYNIFLDLRHGIEVGYKYLIIFSSYVSDDVHIHFTFAVLMSLLFFSLSINRYSKIFSLSCIILMSHSFWGRELNQMRAGIAYSLVLFLIAGYYRRSSILNFALYFLAISFHTTSVFALIPILLSKLYLKSKYTISIILLSILVGSVGSFLLSGLIDSLHLPELIMDKVDKYLDRSSVLVYSLSILNPISVKYLLLFLFSSYFIYKFDLLKDKQVRLIYYCYFCSVCWIYLFRDFAVFAARVASMFSYIEVILLPFVISLIRGRIVMLTSLTLIIAIYVILFSINVFYVVPFFEYSFWS